MTSSSGPENSAPAGRIASFEAWWCDIGSGIIPLPGDDMKSHAKRVAWLAWISGALVDLERRNGAQ